MIASSEELQNCRCGRAIGAVARNVIRKWRSRKSRWLIRDPLGAVHFDSAFSGATPGMDGVASEEIWNRGNWTNRIEGSFCVPGGDASVKDRIAQNEKHLYVIINSVMVPLGDPLCEQRPVSRSLLRVGPIGPVLSNHLLPFGEGSAHGDEFFG